MTRRARLRTTHDDPATVAAAVRPDNTSELRTGVEDGAVVTEIERDRTGGLATTVDDYLVNVRVAERVAATARRIDTQPTDTTHDT